jgi:hypothetical protein
LGASLCISQVSPVGSSELGALAASSLVIGALLGTARPWHDRLVGLVLAFGAGAPISVVSFDLAQKARASATLGCWPSASAWTRPPASRSTGCWLDHAAATRRRPMMTTAPSSPAGGNRACLAVARKLLKRSYHTLRELGEEALQPA